MFRTDRTRDHIPRSDPCELSDDALCAAIDSMENASDSLPRKTALRKERIGRVITQIGLDEAEKRLGVHDA